MKLHTLWWLVIPLAIGCAGSQRETARAGGKSTLSDEGPGSGSSAQAQAGNAQPGAGAASATGAGGAAAQQGPQRVLFRSKGGYTVLMPPNPEQTDRTQDSPGGAVQVHIAQAQDAAGRYLSTYSDFPPGSLKKIQPKDLLDSLQQATVQSMGGTLVGSRDVEAAGLPGREFTATDPQGSEVTARIFVAGSRVYTLAGTYPRGQIPGAMQQFLGSFTPPPSAVGGSGPPDDASGDTATGVDSASSDSADTVTVTPAEPAPRKHTKKSRRSSSSTSTTESTDSSAGAR